MKETCYAGSRAEHHLDLRPMTQTEAETLQAGDHVWFRTIHGDCRQAKVNGKVRRWKRDPDRIEIPLKYGLYEYFTFTLQNVLAGELLTETDQGWSDVWPDARG